MISKEDLEKELKPIEKLLDAHTIDNLIVAGYLDAPASAKYHGNYIGGLFVHSCNVTDALVELTENNNLIWRRKESPHIIGMFHDLCKMDQYKTLEDWGDSNSSEFEVISAQVKFEYNEEVLYKGHGDKSAILTSTYLKLTPEEAACIRYHMGAFTDKEDWKYYNRALTAFPNVLWTHHADMIATYYLDHIEKG